MTRGLVALAWLAVLVVAALLTWDTAWEIQQVGLARTGPPMPVGQTALRIVLVLGALGFLPVRRDPFERFTLLVGALAAGSSMLYGFGMRSPLLSEFRVLSHLLLFVLAIPFAARLMVRALRGNASSN